MASQPEQPAPPHPAPPQPPAVKPARNPTLHAVTFVSYPKLLFVWPVILAGFLFWPIAAPAPDVPAAAAQVAPAGPAPVPTAATRLEWLGWIYLWIVVIVVLTFGIDVDRNMALFWLVLAALVWVGGAYLQHVRNFTFLGDIYRWFGRLDVEYDRSLGLALSIILLVPYVLMLAWGHINDRWRITHNEFEHFSFGKMDDSLGRGAKTVRTTYPDVFELLLGLAGTLIVYSATGTKELRRIPHVMFLPFVRKRLNKILETTAVTAALLEEEEEGEEESPA